MAKKITAQSILFNGAGVALALGSVGYAIHSEVFAPTVAQCSTRYAKSLELGLKGRSGAPMTPIELETRGGAQSRGVLENATVVKAPDGPAPFALMVRLGEDTGSHYQENVTPGGVSFRWIPAGMSGAKEACLSYAVWLPADFKFGQAGVLPGLFGGDYSDPRTHAHGFASRLMWRDEGSGEIDAEVPKAAAQQGAGPGGKIDVQIPISETARSITVGQGSFRMPRGRWVSIEQELALNTPGRADGLVRLWVDGALKIERTDIAWRFENSMSLSGVMADVFYGSVESAATAPADTHVKLAGISARWR